ncbi:unnamed protein product [Protopolystoma xenopodis]|uniref:Potassium channel domain-containing protein n=1 Tax=Protopolystoma xenopodis TaxID=117903 RepID=A0A448X6Y3_9PLAT|nr:unnamed protein product [Protopolystoma xenopodis]
MFQNSKGEGDGGYSSESDSEEETMLRRIEESERVNADSVVIPINVVIGVLAVYILLGASIFNKWEPWSLVDGAYFAFVTLATIGFGDLVPGNGRFDQVRPVNDHF